MPVADLLITLSDQDWQPNATAVAVKLRYTRTRLRSVNVPGGVGNQRVKVEQNLGDFEFIVHWDGRVLEPEVLSRGGIGRRGFVARIDYDGGPPILWKAVAYDTVIKSGDPSWIRGEDPLRGLTTIEQFRERLRLIVADDDVGRRKQKALFYQIDLETHPKLVKDSVYDEMNALRDVLASRLWSRGLGAAKERLSGDELTQFLSTLPDGGPVVSTVPAKTRSALHRFSKQLESLINGYVRQPDDTGAMTRSEFAALAEAVESFANRELEVIDSLGSPDSWGFTYFAELALAAADETGEPFWRQVAAIFCRSSLIFWVEFYRGGVRQAASYRWSKRRRGWTEPMLAKLRSEWPLDSGTCCGSVDSVLATFRSLLCDAALDEIRDATHPDLTGLLSAKDRRLKRSYWTGERS